jgi:hypothetical protein
MGALAPVRLDFAPDVTILPANLACDLAGFLARPTRLS